MTAECPVCYQEHPPGEQTCEQWAAYWRALTPAQRRDEERMMTEYATNKDAD
jgi:predicted nucleic acid-binding Zn ribbon protein